MSPTLQQPWTKMTTETVTLRRRPWMIGWEYMSCFIIQTILLDSVENTINAIVVNVNFWQRYSNWDENVSWWCGRVIVSVWKCCGRWARLWIVPGEAMLASCVVSFGVLPPSLLEVSEFKFSDEEKSTFKVCRTSFLRNQFMTEYEESWRFFLSSAGRYDMPGKPEPHYSFQKDGVKV